MKTQLKKIRVLLIVFLALHSFATGEEDPAVHNHVVPPIKKAIGPGELYWLMDRACYFGDDMSVQMLLNAGAESDGVNDYKAFARFEPIWHLTQAASGGHFKIVDMLLKAGATVDLRCGEGHTALFVAVINKHTEVVQRLIDTGADTSLKVNGETVLEVARSQGFDEIVKIIAGAKGAMEKAR